MHNSLSSAIHLPSPISGSFFTANWTAPRHVKTLMTTRNGGISSGAYHSLNVGTHVGDKPEHVAENRAYVQTQVPVPIAYLQQTHSTIVVQAADSIAAPLNRCLGGRKRQSRLRRDDGRLLACVVLRPRRHGGGGGARRLARFGRWRVAKHRCRNGRAYDGNHGVFCPCDWRGIV